MVEAIGKSMIYLALQFFGECSPGQFTLMYSCEVTDILVYMVHSVYMSVCVGYTNLQSNCMLVFSLHVIDVPGNPLHGVDGLLDYIIHL